MIETASVYARNIILVKAVLDPQKDSLLWVKVSTHGIILILLLEKFPQISPVGISGVGHSKVLIDLLMSCPGGGGSVFVSWTLHWPIKNRQFSEGPCCCSAAKPVESLFLEGC